MPCGAKAKHDRDLSWHAKADNIAASSGDKTFIENYGSAATTRIAREAGEIWKTYPSSYSDAYSTQRTLRIGLNRSATLNSERLFRTLSGTVFPSVNWCLADIHQTQGKRTMRKIILFVVAFATLGLVMPYAAPARAEDNIVVHRDGDHHRHRHHHNVIVIKKSGHHDHDHDHDHD
jgi:hypothetical protein